MLTVRNLKVSFEAPVFSDVSFSLRPGVMYGIVGESGAGKSSLLKVIAGFLDPNQGELLLDGIQLPYASQKLVPGRSSIAYVPQDFQLDPYHTVEENVREAILSYPEPKRQAKVSEALTYLNLKKHVNKQAKFLSGGEKQRLAIARALVTEPAWLLLDEPFAHLDFARKNSLLTYLKGLLASREIGVVVVSHEAHDLLALCSKIAILSRGKLSAFKKVPHVYYSLKNLKDARLLGWVNVLLYKGKSYRFRPNQFVLDPNGIPLQMAHCYFNGLTFVHEYQSLDKERVVLFSQVKLSEKIKININGHEA